MDAAASPALLMRAYRPVRHVTGGTDAPWSGLLVVSAADDPCVLVDVADLTADWRGWTADPRGHILAALDLARTDAGHAAVLPVCTERADEFLDRRERAGITLDPGEAVTLAVSIARAVDECRDEIAPSGEWWLTDSGRPVFATAVEGTPLPDACIRLLAGAAAIGPADAPWRLFDELLTHAHPTAADVLDVESGFFAFADPGLLATVVPAARAGTDSRLAADLAARRGDAVVGAPPATADDSLASRLLRHIDADAADLLSRALTDFWRRMRRRRQWRGAPMLVALLAAAAVVVAGMLWPGGSGSVGDPPRTEGTSSPAASGPESDDHADDSRGGAEHSTPTPSADPSADGDGANDPIGLAGALLDRRRGCADAACLAELSIVDDLAVPPGAVDLPPDARRVELLDDLGDVLVLRVSPKRGGDSQIVVIERREDSWLLRSVLDAEQQP